MALEHRHHRRLAKEAGAAGEAAASDSAMS